MEYISKKIKENDLLFSETKNRMKSNSLEISFTTLKDINKKTILYKIIKSIVGLIFIK